MPHWRTEHHGWIDERGNTHQKPEKIRKAIVWPNDGNRGFLGRLKDISQNKGPDMFVSGNPNRRPGAGDGPSRRRWTGHTDLEDDPNQRKLDKANFIEGKPKKVVPERYYDFGDRKYHVERYTGMITDQILSPDGKVVASERFPSPGTWTPHHPLGNHAAMHSLNHGMNQKSWHAVIHGHAGAKEPELQPKLSEKEKQKVYEEELRQRDAKRQEDKYRDAKKREALVVQELRKERERNADLEDERDAARHPEKWIRDRSGKLHRLPSGIRKESRHGPDMVRYGPKQVHWDDGRRADRRFF